MPDTIDQPEITGLYFQLFNEIGIISQLSRAMFEARLPDGLIVPGIDVFERIVRATLDPRSSAD